MNTFFYILICVMLFPFVVIGYVSYYIALAIHVGWGFGHETDTVNSGYEARLEINDE